MNVGRPYRQSGILGHKHENMTRRYIDCIQKHVDMSSEQYYKEQKSLVSEWKERSDKDGN